MSSYCSSPMTRAPYELYEGGKGKQIQRPRYALRG
jgi:hypothetical protein